MSAHGLLNSLQKRDKMRGKPRILTLFCNNFNKFYYTEARILDFIYNITYKLHFCRKKVKILPPFCNVIMDIRVVEIVKFSTCPGTSKWPQCTCLKNILLV